METTEENLRSAISGSDLDTKDLEQLDLLLTVDPGLAQKAQALLPLITELAQTQPDVIDSFPSTLIPKILSGASLEYIFNLIPPPLFSAGLDQPNTAPLLIQMLARVETTDTTGLDLCEKVVQKLLDPEIEYTGQIEKLIKRLVIIEYTPEFPDQQLYESTDPQLQSRLMAINLILIRAKKQPRFLFWDLTSPDIREDPLLLDIHIIYIGDLCELGVDIVSQIPLLCSMYLNNEPFVGFHIENIFIEMCESAPLTFKQIDSEYGLVAQKSNTLLARMPTGYLAEQPAMIESLVLSSHSLQAFCNLSTNPTTFKMLNLSVAAINGLSFDLRVQLVSAATINSDTARLFVGRFPTVMDAIMVPATNPEAAMYQKEIDANLRQSGMRVSIPEVATAAAQ